MAGERAVWRRPRLIRRPIVRWALTVCAAAYLALTLSTLEVNWARIGEGAGRGARFALAFLHPDFSTRSADVAAGMLESVAMTIVATAAGVALSIPVALGAARNLSPLPIYLACRGVVTLARSFQEVIVAIFFVVMVGFGPLAGVLTLALASVGFLAKLLAEEIEAIDPAQVEAVRATGASKGQIVAFGVLPQILPRFTGLAVYRLDINFRESAVVGVVGAGGIGATLQTAFGRYEYGTAAAILLLIIAIVMSGELLSGRLRRRLV